MNFLSFTIVAIITLIITQFAGAQIIGIICIKIPQRNYYTIIGLVFWVGILYLYYLAIINWFSEFFQVYLWCTVIALIICLLNLKNFKNE